MTDGIRVEDFLRVKRSAELGIEQSVRVWLWRIEQREGSSESGRKDFANSIAPDGKPYDDGKRFHWKPSTPGMRQ